MVRTQYSAHENPCQLTIKYSPCYGESDGHKPINRKSSLIEFIFFRVIKRILTILLCITYILLLPSCRTNFKNIRITCDLRSDQLSALINLLFIEARMIMNEHEWIFIQNIIMITYDDGSYKARHVNVIFSLISKTDKADKTNSKCYKV